MVYRLLILMCLGLYVPSQCLAMEDLAGLEEVKKNAGFVLCLKTSKPPKIKKELKRLQKKDDQFSQKKVSNKVSPEDKIKWMETQSFNIIAAEDDLVCSLILKKFFEGSNNKLTVFENGQKLFDAFDIHIHTLILMDGNMPVLNGWQTIEKLKGKYKDCPPIFAIAASDDEEKSKFIELGVAAFIEKPVSKQILFPVIYDWFNLLQRNQ